MGSIHISGYYPFIFVTETKWGNSKSVLSDDFYGIIWLYLMRKKRKIEKLNFRQVEK